MRTIPANHRKKIDSDPYFKKCLFCSNKPQIHHNFTYARQQISELWNYVPLCVLHHTGEKGVHKFRETKEKVDLHVLLKMTPLDMAKYSKRNWELDKQYLLKKLRGYE